MKVNIEFNITEISVDGTSKLAEEVIKQNLVDYLKELLKSNASNCFTIEPEFYIDISDDGDGIYNTYIVRL